MKVGKLTETVREWLVMLLEDARLRFDDRAIFGSII